jgi:threonylcarbamoyladenosine tRNA methylthiotransferase MtaB
MKPGGEAPGVFSFITLGCKSNQYDSAAMAGELKRAGLEEGAVKKADVIVVNTCMVTGPTEAQCRKAIRQARRANPAAVLVAAGCMAGGVRDVIESIKEVDLIIEPSEKSMLTAFLGIGTAHDWKDWPENPAVNPPGLRDRGFLKIQDGCNAACAYCVVPKVRGRSRSLEPDAVLSAVRELMDRGMGEVVLSGIHLGQYGYGLDPACSLEDLLGKFLHASLPGRVRLSSIEPLEITPRLIEILAGSGGQICRHVHIPLQSGSDRILKAMGRPYTKDRFVDAVSDLAASVPGIGIGCDVICGFPGESEEDFGRTRDLVEKLQIPFVHAFPFSRRPGTRAASMNDDVPYSIKKERVSTLRELAEENRSRFAASFVGAELPTTLESSTDPSGNMIGLSDNYLRVAVKQGSTVLMPGSTVGVMIEKHLSDVLIGSTAGGQLKLRGTQGSGHD